MTKRILAMGAHPDDMELEAGGTLAKWASKGYETHLLVLTSGEYCNMGGEVYKAESLQEEGRRAAKTLNITEVTFLDYIATELPSNGKIVSEVDQIVKDIAPDILISHHPFDSHQDHRAAAEIMFSISRQGRIENVVSCSPLPYRPNVFAFRPQLFIDISATIDAKLDAIRCYKSQCDKYGGEELIERVRSLARVSGWAVSIEFAECFEVVRMNDIF